MWDDAVTSPLSQDCASKSLLDGGSQVAPGTTVYAFFSRVGTWVSL